MVGVTTHVSAELAAVPLLWIVPLSLYLLTFVLVFARRPPPHRLFVRALPIVALIVTFAFAVNASEPLGIVLALHFVMLFVASMVCHGELARDRPQADDLTEFYLWLSIGGVLGGQESLGMSRKISKWILSPHGHAELASVVVPDVGNYSRKSTAAT